MSKSCLFMSAPARTLGLERGPASADTWEAMLAMRVFEMRVVRVMVLLASLSSPLIRAGWLGVWFCMG